MYVRIAGLQQHILCLCLLGHHEKRSLKKASNSTLSLPHSLSSTAKQLFLHRPPTLTSSMAADEPLAPSSQPSSPPPSPNAPPLGSSVIPISNKLQDIFAQLGSRSTMELPQVAVVGSQSSGKSSVLESLVGRDFLPRGSDICTRRPLVLQLLQTNRNYSGGSVEEYGEFLHLPGKRFYDFAEIRKEIQAETEREAGGNKGVSDKQIRLKIYSPNVLDITLVDLPGITKVPVGDQPSDIEARIRTMIISYIKLPSCLILAVTPANADLANSDALQIAGNADPDGHRTIGVITKDIMLNRSIKDALVAEEKFFRSHPVYSDIADRCGIPQLAKTLNQILVQHIKAILPGLKSRISAALVSVAKEHTSYGEITESKACPILFTKAGQGALLLNILSKYSEALSSMIEGKSKEMSTSELSGGARIHYIFQSIYVKSLEEVDPCEGLTDDDIRTAIQNATGPKCALFVPVVPFEVLVRKQIARLLDPSLQCARFIYDELIKMSHLCMVNERQRFPVLRKRMDDVVGNFLRDGLQPSQTMIGHLIEMEMDYINTSHPKFIGGNKAMEIALQQIKSNSVAASTSQKDADPEKVPTTERSLKSRAFLSRSGNGIVPEQGARPVLHVERTTSSASTNGSSWGFSSIFGGTEGRVSMKENSTNMSFSEPVQSTEHAVSTIHLREPPTILRSSETRSDHEGMEIAVTKLLLKSYYDIVRKNIEDSVPKAIMHFLVNHTKRELHNVFIKKLYRDNLFEEMLQEPDEVAMKRKHTRETLCVLQQAFRTLDELPLEAETVERGYSLTTDPTGLPKSSWYSTSRGSTETYTTIPENHKSHKSSDSGELFSPFYPNADSNGIGHNSNLGL
ncbi:hypothetical protein RHMOL_Rhmol05G0123900 [Rhododendron molle]|uniref:Uncharacterized protein n=1 Tax=Rhododendron molle TaxID=49168 RepID=A0ACC0NNK6_RHOML|nr:hypothetical protein RHMOL_Rhmol05G0123900 [Rhododendron molle]